MEHKVNATLKQLYFLARYLSGADIQTVIGAILMDLGFSANKMSFFYLREAIKLYHEDPFQLITYGLYAEVAKRFCKYNARYQIEATVRRAIKGAWQRRSQTTWDCYFPVGVTQREDGPSNLEFIAAMAAVLEMWEGCRKEVRKMREEVIDHEKAE